MADGGQIVTPKVPGPFIPSNYEPPDYAPTQTVQPGVVTPKPPTFAAAAAGATARSAQIKAQAIKDWEADGSPKLTLGSWQGYIQAATPKVMTSSDVYGGQLTGHGAGKGADSTLAKGLVAASAAGGLKYVNLGGEIIKSAVTPQKPTSISNIVQDLIYFTPLGRPIKGLDAIIQGVRAAKDTEEALSFLEAAAKTYKGAGPLARSIAGQTAKEARAAEDAAKAAHGELDVTSLDQTDLEKAATHGSHDALVELADRAGIEYRPGMTVEDIKNATVHAGGTGGHLPPNTVTSNTPASDIAQPTETPLPFTDTTTPQTPIPQEPAADVTHPRGIFNVDKQTGGIPHPALSPREQNLRADITKLLPEDEWPPWVKASVAADADHASRTLAADQPGTVGTIEDAVRAHPELAQPAHEIQALVDKGDLLGAHIKTTQLLGHGGLTPEASKAIIDSAHTIEQHALATNAPQSFWDRLKDESGIMNPNATPGSHKITPISDKLYNTPEMQAALDPANNGAWNHKLPTDTAPKMTVARSKQIAKEITAAGHKLPPSMDTPAKLAREIRSMHEVITQGSAYRKWYHEAADNIKKITDRTGAPPEVVNSLMAVYSPRADPENNALITLRAIDEYVNTGKVEFTNGMGEGQGKYQQAKATQILNDWRDGKTGEAYSWSGRKTTSYGGDVALTPGKRTATIDNRMSEGMFGVAELPQEYYDVAESIVQHLADERGWDPREAQAAAWVMFKAESIIAEAIHRGHTVPSMHEAIQLATDAYHTAVAKYLETPEGRAMWQWSHWGQAVQSIPAKLEGYKRQKWLRDAIKKISEETGSAAGGEGPGLGSRAFEAFTGPGRAIDNAATKLTNRFSFDRRPARPRPEPVQKFTAEEARNMEPSPNHLYHGTSSADQIDQSGHLKAVAPPARPDSEPGVYLSDTPQRAAFGAKHVYQIPKANLNEETLGKQLPFGDYNHQGDIPLHAPETNPNVAQIASEMRPESPEGRAQWDALDPHQQAEYARGVIKASNEAGLEKIVGLDHKGEHFGVGVWRGEENPGHATHVGVTDLNPQEVSGIEAVSAARGIIQDQNSVSWGRPLPAGTRGDGVFQGYIYRPPAGAEGEAGQLGAQLDKEFGPGWVGVTHGPNDSFYIIDFGGSPKFDTKIRSTIGEQHLEPTAWQGGYVSAAHAREDGDWSTTFEDAINNSPHSGALKRAIAAARGKVSDLFDSLKSERGSLHETDQEEYDRLLAQHNKGLDAMADMHFGTAPRNAEANRARTRNALTRTNRGERGGAGRASYKQVPKTIREERREAAQKLMDQHTEATAHLPSTQAWLAREKRIDELHGKLSQQHENMFAKPETDFNVPREQVARAADRRSAVRPGESERRGGATEQELIHVYQESHLERQAGREAPESPKVGGSYTVHRAQEGDDVFTTKGTTTKEQAPNPKFPTFTVKDSNGEMVGSATLIHNDGTDGKPPSLHVSSVYVKPGESANAFRQLATTIEHYADTWDLPITADFQNDKLAKLVAKWADRKNRAAQALKSEQGSFDLGGLFRNKEGRSEEAAAAHVQDQAEKAAEEGYGEQKANHGPGHNPPTLHKGETSDETGGELGAKVRGALQGGPQEGVQGAAQGARSARKEQDVLYHEARQARAAAAEKKLQAGDYEGALHELKGALPKVDFQGFKSFDFETVQAMEEHVMHHPDLKTFEKTNAIGSLRAAQKGKVPTRSQQRILEKAFGKTVRDQVVESASAIHSLSKILQNLLNVPRSLMASMDLSAPFRQGLVAGAAHPVIFAKAFKQMVRSAGSEKYFADAVQNEIRNRATYPLMEKGGVAFTDIGNDAHGAEALSQREEQFMSNYAERIPGLGRMVRGSDRAYVGFLNKIRADVFDHLLQTAAQEGINVGSKDFLEGLARFVNSSTGRGSLGKLNEHTAAFNAFFFAPRLLASRINFLNPVYYAKLHPFARKQALRAMLRLGAVGATTIAIAKAGGASVNANPTSADFGKIRVGNARVDPWGGFQGVVRLAAQLATGRITSSTTGKNFPLGSGFGQSSRLDVLIHFLRGKLSPIPSLVIDAMAGSDVTGNKVSWSSLPAAERQAAQHMVPFLAQDMYDLQQNSGPKALGLGGLDLFGVGIQDYKNQGHVTQSSESKKLAQQGKDSHLGPPPQAVVDDIKWVVQAQKATSANTSAKGGVDYYKASIAIAKLYDQRYGADYETQAAQAQTQGQAQQNYDILKKDLTPNYNAWESEAQKNIDILKAQQGVTP